MFDRLFELLERFVVAVEIIAGNAGNVSDAKTVPEEKVQEKKEDKTPDAKTVPKDKPKPKTKAKSEPKKNGEIKIPLIDAYLTGNEVTLPNTVACLTEMIKYAEARGMNGTAWVTEKIQSKGFKKLSDMGEENFKPFIKELYDETRNENA